MTRLGLWVEEILPESSGRGLLAGAIAVAEAAEAAGFDSLWVSESPSDDHRSSQSASTSIEQVSDDSTHEVYSLLGALAARTRSIRLGAVPEGAEKRAPSVLAKIITGIDVISHGRGVLALTLDPISGEPGLDQLVESLRVCRAVLEEDSPTFSGTYFTIIGAVNRPAPVQRGGVPIVVFADRMGAMRPDVIQVAARYADAVIVDGDAADLEEVVAVMRREANLDGRGMRPVQVIWRSPMQCGLRPLDVGLTHSVGTLEASTIELAYEISDRFMAGADGCIVSLAGAHRLNAIGLLGSALGDAARSFPRRDGNDAQRSEG